jgi:hypothetical protein
VETDAVAAAKEEEVAAAAMGLGAHEKRRGERLAGEAERTKNRPPHHFYLTIVY